MSTLIDVQWENVCRAIARGEEAFDEGSHAFWDTVSLLVECLSTQSPSHLQEVAQKVSLLCSAIGSPASVVNKVDIAKVFANAISVLAEHPPTAIGRRWVTESVVKKKILKLVWNRTSVTIAEIRTNLNLKAAEVANEIDDLTKAGFILKSKVGRSVHISLSPSGLALFPTD